MLYACQRAGPEFQTALSLLRRLRHAHLVNIIYMEQPTRHSDDRGNFGVVDSVHPFRHEVCWSDDPKMGVFGPMNQHLSNVRNIFKGDRQEE